jgi:hypothetical protein
LHELGGLDVDAKQPADAEVLLLVGELLETR